MIRKTLPIPMLLATASLCHASLGDDEDTCRAKYGAPMPQLVHLTRDKYATDNFVRHYHRAQVTFNRHGVAIEIKVYGTFRTEEIAAWLEENGNAWKEEPPKLGSAMDARKVRRWRDPNGRVAELEKGNDAFYLTFFTAARLAQFRENQVNGTPKP